MAVTLLFDENISHIPIEFIAKESGIQSIQHTRKAGWNGWPDHAWMPMAFRLGWVIVSADRNEATRMISAQDIAEAQGRVILLGGFWDNMGIWEKDKWLVNHIEKIYNLAVLLEEGKQIRIDRNANEYRVEAR